jgi:metal-responsive CopG/Arc/MetJ family transcriptional regulator
MPHLSPKTETISVSLPTWLVELLDETCFQKDFTRSCFIKRAIKKYLLTKNENPRLWEQLYDQLMEK